jgi:hypothetical protein
MSAWIELYAIGECPHCKEQVFADAVKFDTDTGSREGVHSDYQESSCDNCNKSFWFKAYCEYNAEMTSVYKTKPKVKK